MFDTTPMSTAVLHKLDKKWTPEGFFKGLKKKKKFSMATRRSSILILLGTIQCFLQKILPTHLGKLRHYSILYKTIGPYTLLTQPVLD